MFGDLTDGGSYTTSRAGIDALCAGGGQPTGTVATWGFISLSETDAIINMPANYDFSEKLPIIYKDYTDTETTIADTWTDMFDGSIDVSFESSGLVDNKFTSWVSGSTSDGSYDTTNNCNGFTTSDGSNSMASGSITNTDNVWIADPSKTNTCDNYIPFICIAIK